MATPINPRPQLAWRIVLRDRAIEQWAESQIDRLIDPDTPKQERQRRIHRLTEGPPEFVKLRVDLARSKKDS